MKLLVQDFKKQLESLSGLDYIWVKTVSSHVRLFATPWTVAYQVPPPMGFSRQEHWSGLPFPSPMHEREKWKWNRSVVSDSLRPHGLQPTRLLRPWDFGSAQIVLRSWFKNWFPLLHCLAIEKLVMFQSQLCFLYWLCQFNWKNNLRAQDKGSKLD